jgi:acylphosphatase
MILDRRWWTVAFLFVLLAMPISVRADGQAKATVGRLVYYSGKVQGVGFRATAVEIARDYPVNGWVKNLDDGRVQLVVEGSAEGVEKFLQAIRTRWKDNIEQEQVEKQEPTGKFKAFEVVK